jgi:hypothetical protein
MRDWGFDLASSPPGRRPCVPSFRILVKPGQAAAPPTVAATLPWATHQPQCVSSRPASSSTFSCPKDARASFVGCVVRIVERLSSVVRDSKPTACDHTAPCAHPRDACPYTRSNGVLEPRQLRFPIADFRFACPFSSGLPYELGTPQSVSCACSPAPLPPLPAVAAAEAGAPPSPTRRARCRLPAPATAVLPYLIPCRRSCLPCSPDVLSSIAWKATEEASAKSGARSKGAEFILSPCEGPKGRPETLPHPSLS